MENQVSLEEIIMELVVNSGAARSAAMGAIEDAKNGEFEQSYEKIADAKEKINKAHAYQTELMTKEANGEKQEMSLIMVHGQDHLMTALLAIDMAEQMIELYKKLTNN